MPELKRMHIPTAEADRKSATRSSVDELDIQAEEFSPHDGITIADPLVQALREATFRFGAPLEAASRQHEAAQEVLSRQGADVALDLPAALAERLDPIVNRVLSSMPDVGAEARESVAAEIAGQRHAIEAKTVSDLRSAEIARVRETILPQLLGRVRRIAGDDPRRASDMFEKCDEIGAGFAPLIGEEEATAICARLDRENARVLADKSLSDGDLDGLEHLLEAEARRFRDSDLTDLKEKLQRHRESIRDAAREGARRLLDRLTAAHDLGDDGNSSLEQLKDLAAASEDADMSAQLSDIEALLRFRRLSPTEKEIALEKSRREAPESPMTQRLENARDAAAALSENDPLEAARRAGAVDLPDIRSDEDLTPENVSALVRTAFAAQRWGGGPLRFSTNRQRDALIEQLEREPVETQLRRLDELVGAFGPFGDDILAEIAPVSPSLAKAGELQRAGAHRDARQHLVGMAMNDPTRPFRDNLLAGADPDESSHADMVGSEVEPTDEPPDISTEPEVEAFETSMEAQSPFQLAAASNANRPHGALPPGPQHPGATHKVPKVFFGGITQAFANAIAYEESRGYPDSQGYAAYHKSGTAFGRYQLTAGALTDALYLKNGTWTGRRSKVGSLAEFLNSPSAQDDAFAHFIMALEEQFSKTGTFKNFVGKRLQGVKADFVITRSGLLAAAHRAGTRTVKRYLKHLRNHGWKSDPSTFPGTRRMQERFLWIETRMRKFASIPLR